MSTPGYWNTAAEFYLEGRNRALAKLAETRAQRDRALELLREYPGAGEYAQGLKIRDWHLKRRQLLAETDAEDLG